MIENISLKNFKVSRSTDINISPLTVLAGLNGAGKSTSLQAIGLLKQSYDEKGQIDGLNLSGDLIKLGKWRDVLTETSDDEFISISVCENGKNFEWSFNGQFEDSELNILVKPSDAPSFTSSDFQYLQADRIIPSTLYPQSSYQSPHKNGFLGIRGEYTADYLALNPNMDVPEKRRANTNDIIPTELAEKVSPTPKLLDQIASWLQFLSPGARLKTSRVPGADEVLLQFNYTSHKIDIAGSYRPTNVGFGLTYSLPIIVACLSAPKGALLLLENPEAHLHPRGQSALGELLAQCAADGVQIIVETHSDHLLNGIRQATKKSTISSDDVALHFFSRSTETGETNIESPKLLPNGKLTSWPDGFFDQWDKSLDILLDD